jgi:ppGpp synthetase/RelA/SpoT-type nucleotidyltranferase
MAERPGRESTLAWRPSPKLGREQHLSLDQVQDLAGVRVDGDFTLDVQLALEKEVAAHFGDRSVVKDIRSNPHNGYSAVHLWVRCPAGAGPKPPHEKVR